MQSRQHLAHWVWSCRRQSPIQSFMLIDERRKVLCESISSVFLTTGNHVTSSHMHCMRHCSTNGNKLWFFSVSLELNRLNHSCERLCRLTGYIAEFRIYTDLIFNLLFTYWGGLHIISRTEKVPSQINSFTDQRALWYQLCRCFVHVPVDDERQKVYVETLHIWTLASVHLNYAVTKPGHRRRWEENSQKYTTTLLILIYITANRN